MKKVTFIMALAVGAGLASCTAQSPKANLKTDVDSLSYAIGMARTEGLTQYLMQQGVDTTQMAEFIKGFNEGAAKTSKKDVAYMTGMQIGQMVGKQWVEGFNQQIFGGDSTQTISRENLLAGFIAGIADKSNVMTKEAATAYMRDGMEAIKEKALAVKYADNKAAGKQCIARPFYNGVGFTRKQGLVDLALPVGHHGVGADLVARGQQQDVVQHHLLDGDALALAPPQHVGLGGGDEGQLVDGALGPDALEGPDEDVGEDDPHEQGAPGGAHQDHRQGQSEV